MLVRLIYVNRQTPHAKEMQLCLYALLLGSPEGSLLICSKNTEHLPVCWNCMHWIVMVNRIDVGSVPTVLPLRIFHIGLWLSVIRWFNWVSSFPTYHRIFIAFSKCSMSYIVSDWFECFRSGCILWKWKPIQASHSCRRVHENIL